MKTLLEWLKSKSQYKYIILMFVVACLLVASGVFCLSKLNQKSTTLAQDHVLICDNPAYDSDFDKWLKEDLGIDWVPTYVIINNRQIIGAIRGGIPLEQFSSQLALLVSYNIPIKELTDLEVTDLTGNRRQFSGIFGDGLYVLEISWAQCKDCQEQDEKFTKRIYKEYGTDIFYRYYIRTEKNEVQGNYE